MCAIQIKTDSDRDWSVGKKRGSSKSLRTGYLAGVYGWAGWEIDALGFYLLEEIVDFHVSELEYDLDEYEILTSRPLDVQDMPIDNETNVTQSGTCVSYMESFTARYDWSNSVGLTIGGKGTVRAGVPLFADGSVEVSSEAKYEHTWSEGHEDTVVRSAELCATVPPKSYVLASMKITKVDLDVPYTAVVRVTFKSGHSVTREISGVYEGVAYSRVDIHYSEAFPLDD